MTVGLGGAGARYAVSDTDAGLFDGVPGLGTQPEAPGGTGTAPAAQSEAGTSELEQAANAQLPLSVRGGDFRTDTAVVPPSWCCARPVFWRREVFRSRAPRDAERPVGWPQNLQASRGQGPSPARARTARLTAKFLACCVRRAPDDGQAAHGGPGQRRPIRPLAAAAHGGRFPRRPSPSTSSPFPPSPTLPPPSPRRHRRGH